MPAVTLREAPHRKAVCEAEMRYDVLLDGVKVDEAYFNTRGYRAGLPVPGGGRLDPGEVSLSQLRKDIAQINRQWAEVRAGQPALKPAPHKRQRAEASPSRPSWSAAGNSSTRQPPQRASQNCGGIACWLDAQGVREMP